MQPLQNIELLFLVCLLGAWQNLGTKLWYAVGNKVTNLNIFSANLSTDRMQQITTGAGCAEEGDFLSWTDMKWNLHGLATVESVNSEKLCLADAPVNLFFTGFPGMKSCMYFCQNIGTRVPSVVTL